MRASSCRVPTPLLPARLLAGGCWLEDLGDVPALKKWTHTLVGRFQGSFLLHRVLVLRPFSFGGVGMELSASALSYPFSPFIMFLLVCLAFWRKSCYIVRTTGLDPQCDPAAAPGLQQARLLSHTVTLGRGEGNVY